MNTILLICVFLVSVQIFSKEDNLEKNVRTLVNLLDYIGTDYHNAVANGKVINTDEYSEMIDFIGRAETDFKDVSGSVKTINPIIIKNELDELSELINRKVDKKIITERANNIKLKILSLNIIEISPLQWPDIINGEKIFKKNCTSCHGESGRGDGPLSAKLNPKPADLLSNALMNNISSFQIYNTVRLGVNGTSMPSFDKLNDQQIWDAAFYVSSLRYKNKYNISKDSLNKLYKDVVKIIPLEKVSTKSDIQLLNEMNASGKNDSMYLAAIRLHEPKNNSNISMAKASLLLNDALNLYKAKKYDESFKKSLAAYLEGIEPYEQQLIAVNSGLKIEIEGIMTKVRNDIKSRTPENKLNEDIVKANELIGEASSLLNDQNFSFWFSFLLAASILLREGLEAFLIIATILGVLKSLEAKRATAWVHGGWITALIIGIISMFFTNMLISFGAQSREMMEGIGSLIAVVMLLYIGFWLHSKTEAKKWKEFVEGKIVRMIDGNNMWGLAVISFVVVFREAFESVIFLSAVNIEAGQTGRGGAYLGAASALMIVLVLSWIAVRFAAKLPVRKLFQYSALTMGILSVVLIGKGIHALQESGYSSSTLIPFKLNFSWLGVYPTAETFIAQGIVLVLAVFLWRISSRPSPKVKAMN